MEASLLPVIENEPVHEEVAIDCGKHNFAATRAANYCPQCEYFHGVVSLLPDQVKTARKLKEKGLSINDIPWDQRFAIKCAYPKERRVVLLKVIE